MPGSLHNHLTNLGRRLLIAEGFTRAFDGETLDCGRHGERPDVLAWTDREIELHGWGEGGESTPEPIRALDSAVVEVKATRADFLANASKNHAQWMGVWRLWLCPRGVIQPGEVPPGDGLYWSVGGGEDFDQPADSWQLKKRPLRNCVVQRQREMQVLIASLDRALHRPTEQNAAAAAASPSAKRPFAERKLSPVARAAAALLRPEDGCKAAHLLTQLGREQPTLAGLSRTTPRKLENELRSAGFPADIADGITLWRAKDAGGAA